MPRPTTLAAAASRGFGSNLGQFPTAPSRYSTPGSYSYTIPAFVKSINVQVTGGGGGGSDGTGDVSGIGRTNGTPGAGGGAAPVVTLNNYTVTTGQVLSITVGAGGGGGGAYGNSGATGGTSSVYIGATKLAMSTGGSGGGAPPSNGGISYGGGAGSGSGAAGVSVGSASGGGNGSGSVWPDPGATSGA